MNDYDKYINDDLMSKIYKNRLEKTNNNDNDNDDFDNVFYNKYTSKKVVTCVSNESKINYKELEEFLTIVQNQLAAKRFLSYWECFCEPVFNMNIFP